MEDKKKEPLFADRTTSAPSTFVVRRDKEPDIRFKGWLVGSITSEAPGSRRWYELAIYLSVGGKIVCSRVGRSAMPGELSRSWATVAEDQAEIEAFFGLGPLSKSLYEVVGLDASTWIP